MKATELASNNYFKGIIYGEAGVGKTCLAASFPGPIEYWDFDSKISSAVRYLTSQGKTEQLEQIDVHQFSRLPVKERIPAWEKRGRMVDEFILNGKPLPFKTLVIDSLTLFSHHIMEDYVFRSQLGIKRATGATYSQQDYGLFASHMTRILTGLISQLDCHFVVLGHVETHVDESTGVITKRPLVTGQRIAPMLPAWFEEVYAARVLPDGKRVLQTQSGDNFVVRNQRGLNKFIDMRVEEILK